MRKLTYIQHLRNYQKTLLFKFSSENEKERYFLKLAVAEHIEKNKRV